MRLNAGVCGVWPNVRGGSDTWLNVGEGVARSQTQGRDSEGWRMSRQGQSATAF